MTQKQTAPLGATKYYKSHDQQNSLFHLSLFPFGYNFDSVIQNAQFFFLFCDQCIRSAAMNQIVRTIRSNDVFPYARVKAKKNPLERFTGRKPGSLVLSFPASVAGISYYLSSPFVNTFSTNANRISISWPINSLSC